MNTLKFSRNSEVELPSLRASQIFFEDLSPDFFWDFLLYHKTSVNSGDKSLNEIWWSRTAENPGIDLSKGSPQLS